MLNGWKTYLGAAVLVLSALSCIATHVQAGDFLMHWQECVAGLGTGIGLTGLRHAMSRQAAGEKV